MAFITRLELHDEKFCQSYGEVLTLSGLTRISSIGKLQYTTNQSGSYIAKSIPNIEKEQFPRQCHKLPYRHKIQKQDLI